MFGFLLKSIGFEINENDEFAIHRLKTPEFTIPQIFDIYRRNDYNLIIYDLDSKMKFTM